MKKILTILIIMLSVFLIYIGFKDKKIYYLSLGDYLANGINQYGIKDYGYTDYIIDYLKDNDIYELSVDGTISNKKTSIDIINDIEDNVLVKVKDKEKTFQNVLIKADLITISLGLNDLLNDLEFNSDFSINDLYSKLEGVLLDYDKMFKLIRSYSKEKIFFIGIYNPSKNEELSDFFQYANAKIENLCSENNIKYINIYEDFDKYLVSNSLFPNKSGYKLIADKIIFELTSWFFVILFAII